MLPATMAAPATLKAIAESRKRDPLAPVTVVVPSHVAAIHLRRRLAELGAYAGVRFETLPRLAELLGAGELARAGRRPLARPIGDYLATRVALDASDHLAAVRELGGFARVLRENFRRLRRGGFGRPEDIPVRLDSGMLGEVVRLYGLFRQRGSEFYDEEDLLDAAASLVGQGRGPAFDLGGVYVLPPGALSAGAERLLTSLRRWAGAGRFHMVGDAAATRGQSLPTSSMVLAPDPASEAREVAREVLRALAEGCSMHEIAVFHGADPSYRELVARSLESAGIHAASMPGTPLSRTPAGRAVLALAELPLSDYARTATFDWLSLAPLLQRVPGDNGLVFAKPAAWRGRAREAGVTKTQQRWELGLAMLIADKRAALAAVESSEASQAIAQSQLEDVEALRSVMRALIARLEPLRRQQAAASFVAAFRRLVDDYFEANAQGFDEVKAQIDQLGTIDAVQGSFNLSSFAASLRANLDATTIRHRQIGDGVLVADYRLAAGLDFRRVVLCGAYEGAFPARAPAEALVDDASWSFLRSRGFPHLEDADLRLQRSAAAAQRAVASAGEHAVWSAPLQESAAGREYYPSRLMVAAAQTLAPDIASAGDLRTARASDWLRRPPSPLAAMLARPLVDNTELRLQSSLALRRRGSQPGQEHPLAPSLALLRARRGSRFSEYDGNLSQLQGDVLIPRGVVSPTSLEHYAACGMRYFLRSVLSLRPPDEPDEGDTMDPRDKGSLIHDVLNRFFTMKLAEGRPRPMERWTEDDLAQLLAIADERSQDWRHRGRTGLDVFAQHEQRRIRAELSAFLEDDNEFRASRGTVPFTVEERIPETVVAGLRLTGIVDRVDLSPDGRRAWVIDYKTGSTRSYEGMTAGDPLAGGTKLQLPVYMAAAGDAGEITPLYWFIPGSGDFEKPEFPVNHENLARYEQTLAAILHGVRSGIFPAIPGAEDTLFGGFTNCRYCDYNRLCSRRRDEELLEKQQDGLIQSWTRVGETARGLP
jgi:ATP-dependent helicase/nuclease subunit B